MTETLEELTSRQAKEIEEVIEYESTNDGNKKETKDSKETTPIPEKPEVDTSYDEYEKKTKDSDRISYNEKEIEIEGLEDGE